MTAASARSKVESPRASWEIAKRFLVLFLPALALAVGGAMVLYYFNDARERAILKTHEATQVQHQGDKIAHEFEMIASDLIYLAGEKELQEMLHGGEAGRAHIAEEYLRFSAKNRRYNQIRFLDETGMEVVRVNFNNRKTTIVPEGQLQSKADRSYFKETIRLKEGEVYLSPFDLNVEWGKIEQPLKPVLRLGTPIFDSRGRKRGVLVLKFLGVHLLHHLEPVHAEVPEQIMLLNSDGFWLKGPVPEDEWGFMYGNDRRFEKAFPEAWRRISSAESGQFYHASSLFTFTTPYPLLEVRNSITAPGRPSDPKAAGLEAKAYYWKIVSRVPPDVLSALSRGFLAKLLLVFPVLVAVLGIGCWFLAHARANRKRAEEQIKRHHQRLETLREIGLATTSSLDLCAVLDVLMDKIGSLLPNFATEVWLFDRESRQLERIVCGNLDEKEWMRRKLLDTPPLLKAALEQKAPLIVSNVQTDPRIVDPSFFRMHGLVSYLGVPLIAKGEGLGVITFMTREEHQFSKEESEFLTTLAGQAAIAIHNSQLYQQITVQALQLENEIIERKQAEEVLRQSEAKFYKLFEFAPEAILAVNRDGHIALVNTKAESLFGYTREELLGRSVEMLIPERLRDGYVAHHTRYLSQLSSRSMGSGVKLYGVRKDGHEFPAEISLNPIETEKGILVTTTILDISNLKEAEEERDRLFAETKRNLEYISALYSVTSAASECLELDSILQEAIKKVIEIFHFDATRIFLFNPQENELHLRASLETNPEFFAGVRAFRRGQGLVGRVADTGEALIFEDVLSDPRYQELSQSKLCRKGKFSFFAGIPIKVKKRPIGVLVCVGKDARLLTPDEERLVTSMANQIGVAVENATLFQETVTRARELSALYSVSTIVNKSLELDSILSDVMYDILEIFHFNAARIYLFDEDRKELCLKAHLEFPRDFNPPSRYKLSQGFIGKVFETGEPLFFDDIQNSPEFHKQASRKILLKAGFHGHFSIPIGAKGRTIGVMDFVSKEPHHFSPSENQLSLSIANHVGIAVENARLYKQTKEQASQLEKDITERKRAEEELKQANTELARHEKALRQTLSDLRESHKQLKTTQSQLIQAEKLESVGRLAAGVAHEVKNPLAIMLQGIHYLSKHHTANGDNVAMALQDMNDAVKRADSVVRGLLDFSAPSELSLNTEELNSVVEQSLLLVRHELDRYHVNAVRELSECLPPVRMDRNKMEQVFINLFLNAVHAMPEGGTLTIKTYTKRLTEVAHNVGSRKADDFRVGQTVVMAEVEDTGTGISKEQLAQIFDPFFTTKSTGKGTGLGLTVTKKIIDLHGGTIDIGNHKEGGVRASIMLKAQGGNDHEEETDSAH